MSASPFAKSVSKSLRIFGSASLCLAGFFSSNLASPNSVCSAASPDTWPAFLGEGAVVESANRLPLKWSPDTNQAWKVETRGHGQSSPVVWDGKVYLTSVDGPNKETQIVFCFSLEDGSLLWEKEFKNSYPVESSLYVSRAAPTCVVDASQVLAFFESGDLVALDHDGNLRWQRSIGEDFGGFKNKFGLGSSPVQDDDRIYVLIDDEGPSGLFALSKATGETVWKVERTPRSSWASPTYTVIADVPQIVVSSDGTVDSYSAADGTLLWSKTGLAGNTKNKPWPVGDNGLLIGGGPGRDGNNADQAKKTNQLLVVDRTEDGWKVETAWVNEDVNPGWASPMIHQGRAYWVNSQGIVHCIDLADGKTVYRQRTKQQCWATPFAAEDRIYFFGKDGLTTVLAAGDEFKVLSENELWDPASVKLDEAAMQSESSEERRRAAAMFAGPTQYGFAVADGAFVVRTGETLVCLRNLE